MSEANKNAQPEAIITPDYIEIPRFGGQRERISLPRGSSDLVKEYLQSENLETELDAAISTIAKAKKIIADQRKLFMYEIMGRARQEALVTEKKNLSKIIKDGDKFDDTKPNETPKKKKPVKK